jgi:Spy/CpxP family protein refolding chaperone
MKRIVIWSSVAALLVACGVGIAVAGARGCHRWVGRGWGHGGPLGYLSRELDLSREQRQQIGSMWQAERPAMLSLVHEFAAESKEMDEATAKGNVDEGKVQEIAARQGTTVARFLVEKEHFKARIYATVLNPGQRTKADELQSRWHERLGKL